jgi:hypothetical protein
VLSEKTVRNHVSAILVKLQVPDRASAVAKARDAGIGTNQPLQTERGAVALGTMSRIPSLGLSRCQVKEIGVMTWPEEPSTRITAAYGC